MTKKKQLKRRKKKPFSHQLNYWLATIYAAVYPYLYHKPEPEQFGYSFKEEK